jgi:flagellar assembly factor FliW
MIANTLSRTGRLVFTAPPPGLSPVVDFDLDEVEGAVGLYSMQDAVGADLRLFLLDPAFFVPEYQPQLSAEHLAPLGAESPEQVDLYVVATLSGGAPVVNLLAPILVHPVTHAAAQVILDGEDWPLQAELIAPEA